MNICNGKCLRQVWCTCYNEETDEDFEECVCGHREHEGCYLPSDCCSPVECRNYEHCYSKLPKYILDVHNGMCANCAQRSLQNTEIHSNLYFVFKL